MAEELLCMYIELLNGQPVPLCFYYKRDLSQPDGSKGEFAYMFSNGGEGGEYGPDPAY